MFVKVLNLYLIWYNIATFRPCLLSSKVHKRYWPFWRSVCMESTTCQGKGVPIRFSQWSEDSVLHSPCENDTTSYKCASSNLILLTSFSQDNRAEAKGERWEWRHRRRSFAPTVFVQPWQQLLILPGLWCVWSGIKPENRKTPWRSPINNSLSRRGRTSKTTTSQYAGFANDASFTYRNWVVKKHRSTLCWSTLYNEAVTKWRRGIELPNLRRQQKLERSFTAAIEARLHFAILSP